MVLQYFENNVLSFKVPALNFLRFDFSEDNMKKYFLALCLVTMNPANASDCNALLKHGIRNIEISKSTEAAVVTKYFNHCEKDYDSYSDSTLAAAEVEVFGYGAGGGSYDRSRASTKLNEWCKTNESLAKGNSALYEETRTIYSEALNAWNQCNDLANREQVFVDHVISPDSSFLEISLAYKGGARSGVEFFGVKSRGFTCAIAAPNGDQDNKWEDADGDLAPDKPYYIDRQAVSISCDRDAASIIERNSGEYSVKSAGMVSLRTASAPYQIFFPEQYTPTLPTRRAEVLEAEMQKVEIEIAALQAAFKGSVLAFEADTCPSGWSVYAPASGRFIRGIDIVNAGNDPDGVRLPGSVQADAFQTHQHLMKIHTPGTTGSRNHENMEYQHPNGKIYQTTEIVGGSKHHPSETRPVNVALLYCKKD